MDTFDIVTKHIMLMGSLFYFQQESANNSKADFKTWVVSNSQHSLQDNPQGFEMYEVHRIILVVIFRHFSAGLVPVGATSFNNHRDKDSLQLLDSRISEGELHHDFKDLGPKT